MPGGTPTVNGTGPLGPMGPATQRIGAGGPGDMNNNGLSGPGGLGSVVKAPPMTMPAPTS